MRSATLISLLLALSASPSLASPRPAKNIQWKKDARAALREAEDRGTCLLLYLTRDD
jgi:hypothetical protein